MGKKAGPPQPAEDWGKDRWQELGRFEIKLWEWNRRRELKLDLRKYARLSIGWLAVTGLAMAGAAAVVGPVWAMVLGTMAAPAVIGAILTRWLRIECSWMERLIWEARDYARYDLRGEVNDLAHQVRGLRRAIEHRDGKDYVRERADEAAMIEDAKRLYKLLDGTEDIAPFLTYVSLQSPTCYAKMEAWFKKNPSTVQ